MRHEHQIAGLEPLVVQSKVVYVAQHAACAETCSFVVHVQIFAHFDQEGRGVLQAGDVLAYRVSHSLDHDLQDVLVLIRFQDDI